MPSFQKSWEDNLFFMLSEMEPHLYFEISLKEKNVCILDIKNGSVHYSIPYRYPHLEGTILCYIFVFIVISMQSNTMKGQVYFIS